MLTRIGAEWEERKMTEKRWEGWRIRGDSQLERGDWEKNGGLGGQEEEENSWEETLATSLQILARAKAQLPGDFVVVRFDGVAQQLVGGGMMSWLVHAASFNGQGITIKKQIHVDQSYPN